MTGYIGLQEKILNNIIDSGSINNTTSGWTKSNSTAITLTQGTDYVTYTVSTTTTAEIYKTFSLGPYTSTTSTSTITYLATSSFYVRSSAPSFSSTTGYFSGNHTTTIKPTVSTAAVDALNKYFIPVDGAPPTSTSTYYGTTYYTITAASFDMYNGGTLLTLQPTESSLKTDKQIIYAQVKVKSSSSNSSYPIRYIRRYLNGAYDACRLQAIDGTAETALNDNQWHTSSAYLETYDGTNVASYDRFCLQFNSAVVNNTFDFKDVIIINLTSVFGSGNEPSKEWCDEHISQENNAVICFQQSGFANKIQKMYIGIDGVAHIVRKAYIGIDNVAKLWYSEPVPSLAQVFSTMNSYTVSGPSNSTASTASLNLSSNSNFVTGADIFLFLTVGGSLEISRVHVDSSTSASKTRLSLTAASGETAQTSSISGTTVTTDNAVYSCTWGAFYFDNTYRPSIIEDVFKNCIKYKLKYYYNSGVASNATSSSDLRYSVASLSGTSGIIFPMFTGSNDASTVTWYRCFSASTCDDPLTVIKGAQGSSWLTTRPAVYQAAYSGTNYLYPTVTGSAPVKNCRSYCLHRFKENW